MSDIGVISDLIKNMETLESSISKLKIDIVKKEKELNETVPLTMDSFGTNENVIQKKKIEEEDLELKSIYTNLKNNELQIRENIKEYTIEYISNEQINALYINGDFTNWELKEMNKNKDIFSYTTILLNGFKYYYSLQANDEIFIDFDKPHENNIKNGQIQNYIDLCKNNKEIYFDYKQHENILNIAKRNFYILKMENYDEISFLNSLAKNSEVYNKCQDKTNYEKNILFNSLGKYFEKKEKELQIFSDEEMHKIMSFFYDRILMKKNKDNTETYYQIIKDAQNQFQCVQLYDSNHIKINTEYYINNGLYFNFSMSLVAPSREANKKGEKLYTLLSKEESNKILEEYSKDVTNVLKVFYKPINQEKFGYLSFRNNLINPTRIEPSHINIFDYSYEADDNHLIQVKNIKDNAFILFNGNKEIKQKKNKTLQFQIYYQLINRINYIIHSHVLDNTLKNKEILIQNIDYKIDYKKLKKEGDYIKNDFLLLLIRSFKPFKLYYKGKKVQMESQNIILNKMYKINSPNPDSGFNNMIVRVENIPRYVLNSDNSKITSNNEIYEKCNNNYYEKPNSGVVDVIVLFDERKNIVNEIMKFALNPCLLKPLESNEEIELDKRYNDKNKKIPFNNNKSYELQKLDIIIKQIDKYKIYKSDENAVKKLSKENKETIIFTLEDYQISLNSIGTFIQNNELWDLLEKVSSVGSEINNILNALKK